MPRTPRPRVARKWPASNPPHPFATRKGQPDESASPRPRAGVKWRRSDGAKVVEQLGRNSGPGWPKNSGGRACRLAHRAEGEFGEVRRARSARARGRRRATRLAKQMVEGRTAGVFVVTIRTRRPHSRRGLLLRPTPDARVSRRFTEDEVRRRAPQTSRRDYAERFAEWATSRGIDEDSRCAGSLRQLSARHESEGLGDATWPTHYKKQPGENDRATARPAGEAPLIEIVAPTQADALAGLKRIRRNRHLRRQPTANLTMCWSNPWRPIVTWTRIGSPPGTVPPSSAA